MLATQRCLRVSRTSTRLLSTSCARLNANEDRRPPAQTCRRLPRCRTRTRAHIARSFGQRRFTAGVTEAVTYDLLVDADVEFGPNISLWQCVIMSAVRPISSGLHENTDLAASLAGGVAAEFVRRNTSQQEGNSQGGLVLTEANVNRLVDKLSRMRGAALKLGQFLSIQGSTMR